MTFLEELKSAREAATPGPWVHGEWRAQCHMDHPHQGPPACRYEYTLDIGQGVISSGVRETLVGYGGYGTVLQPADAELICLLVNNAETIERFLIVAGEVAGWDSTLRAALAALNEEAIRADHLIRERADLKPS